MDHWIIEMTLGKLPQYLFFGITLYFLFYYLFRKPQYKNKYGGYTKRQFRLLALKQSLLVQGCIWVMDVVFHYFK